VLGGWTCIASLEDVIGLRALESPGFKWVSSVALRMNLGLCTITNKDWPVEDVLALAAEAGYDGVEIWGQDHVGNPGGDGEPDIETCHAIADTAADLGVEIPVYGSYLRPGTSGFDEGLGPELDAAVALGADLVRVWPGDQEFGEHDPDHWESVVADLETTGERAADRDVAITVEKHEGTLSNTTEGARRLIESVDAAAVGLNWQPLFFLDADAVAEEAAALAPLSNNIHLQATHERGGEQRSPLAEAYFDLPSILDTFDRAGFEGYAEVEFVDPTTAYEEAVRADREYLAEIVP